jgi:hypothetical protein
VETAVQVVVLAGQLTTLVTVHLLVGQVARQLGHLLELHSMELMVEVVIIPGMHVEAEAAGVALEEVITMTELTTMAVEVQALQPIPLGGQLSGGLYYIGAGQGSPSGLGTGANTSGYNSSGFVMVRYLRSAVGG